MAPSTRLVWALALAGMVTALAGRAQDDGLAPETLSQATPVFAFQSQGNRSALVFTRNGTAEGYAPRVFLASRDGGWRLIQLADGLANTNWIFAGRAITGDDVWGITQASTGALTFVASQNGGRNWRSRGSLQAVSPKAVVDLFSVNDEGKGTLILRLDEEDPNNPAAPRAGHYVYISKNGGKTWSEAIYSQGKPTPPPNLLLPPDRTFDAQQPLDVGSWQRLLLELQPVS